MRTLLLCRHAKSDWGNPSMRDFDRPLNERGLGAAPKMGRRLLKMGEKPDLIVSSPAARAIETARLMAVEIGYDPGHIAQDECLYLAPPDVIGTVVEAVRDSIRSVLIVAHNPGINQFVNRYAPEPIDNVPTCGVCRIDFETDSWDGACAAPHRFVFFEYPKKPA